NTAKPLAALVRISGQYVSIQPSHRISTNHGISPAAGGMKIVSRTDPYRNRCPGALRNRENPYPAGERTSNATPGLSTATWTLLPTTRKLSRACCRRSKLSATNAPGTNGGGNLKPSLLDCVARTAIQ